MEIFFIKNPLCSSPAPNIPPHFFFAFPAGRRDPAGKRGKGPPRRGSGRGQSRGKPDPWQPAETVQTALFVQHIVLAEGVQRLNQTIFRFIIQTGIFFFKIIEYIHGLPHRKRP
mgnify:FL=1